MAGSAMDFVNDYLGTTLVAGECLSLTAWPVISSFLRATNDVTNVLTSAHEHTLLTLLYFTQTVFPLCSKNSIRWLICAIVTSQ